MNRIPPPRSTPPPPGGRRPTAHALPAPPPGALKALVVLTAVACLGVRIAAVGG